MSLLFRFRYYLLILLLLIAAKPSTVYLTELYLTSLFEKPVKIEQLDLIGKNATLTFDKPSNRGHIQLQKLYPDFKALIEYTGDVDAFSAFHPLQGEATAQATVTAEQINVTLSAYKATAKIKIYNRDSDWTVTGEINGLELQELAKANHIPVEMKGLVNATLDVHTDADSSVYLFSDTVQIEQNHLTNINLVLASQNEKLLGEGMFDSKDIDYQAISLEYDRKTELFNANVNFLLPTTKREFDLRLNGHYRDGAIEATADIDSGKTHIDIDNFKAELSHSRITADWKFDSKNLNELTILPKLTGHTFQGELLASGDFSYADKKTAATLHSNSLDGTLGLTYQDEQIHLKAEKIALEKLLHIAMIDQNATGKITAEGSWSKSSGRGEITIPDLKINENSLDNLLITLKQTGHKIEADISANHAMATLKQSHTVYEDGHIQTTAKLSVEQLPDDLSLSFDGTYKNSTLDAKLDLHSKSIDLTLNRINYSDAKLKSPFQLTIQNRLIDLI